MTDAHTSPHSPTLTPEQAAQLAKVSRWTILRAIKSQRLQARRDNHNRWQISPQAVQDWCAHTVQAQPDAPLAPEIAQADETPALRAALAAETARADAAERARDQAEADRDQWRDMAQTLANRRGSIWPWRR